MEYAPIIIPTLNRNKHLKRCVESLAKCKLANQTELFISVDYPPSAKYQKGYLEVCDFLSSFDFSSFKNTCITYQTNNLGAAGNNRFLQEQVRGKYTKVIYTEDDCEFSPNFLVYINESLKRFENDKRVISICGATDTNWKSCEGSNVVATKFAPSYGIASWITKRDAFAKEGTNYLLNKDNWTIGNFVKLFRRNRLLFSKYILDILLTNGGVFWHSDGTLNFCDTPKAIYYHLSDYMTISPVKPMSRTFGNDGSGLNMPKLETVEEVSLDETLNYSICYNDPILFDNNNYPVGEAFLLKQYNDGKKWSGGIILSVIGASLLLFLGKDRRRTMSWINNTYRLFGKSYNLK